MPMLKIKFPNNLTDTKKCKMHLIKPNQLFQLGDTNIYNLVGVDKSLNMGLNIFLRQEKKGVFYIIPITNNEDYDFIYEMFHNTTIKEVDVKIIKKNITEYTEPKTLEDIKNEIATNALSF